MTQRLLRLQKKLAIKFKSPKYLSQALIHRSYLNENQKKGIESNERYEFLGDAVLELWASDTLFRLFPAFPEGKLTNLRSLVVCTQNLCQVAQNINLGQYITMSKGEEANGGRRNTSILADTFESLVGAIYLDQGIKNAFSCLQKLVYPSLQQLSRQKIYKDPKSIFQELAQAQVGATPKYKTLAESGPDHQKIFKVGAYINDKLIASGKGHSKQIAAEQAATKATKKLNNKV